MRILYLTHQLLWIPPHVDLQIKSGNRVLSHFDIFTFPVAPLSAEPRLFSQNLSCFFLFISSLCFSHGHGFALPLLSLKRRKMKGLGQREMQTQHSLEKILFVAKEKQINARLGDSRPIHLQIFSIVREIMVKMVFDKSGLKYLYFICLTRRVNSYLKKCTMEPGLDFFLCKNRESKQAGACLPSGTYWLHSGNWS